jgi:hypothetical protein
VNWLINDLDDAKNELAAGKEWLLENAKKRK